MTRSTRTILAESAGPLVLTLLAIDLGHAWLVRPADTTLPQIVAFVALAFVAVGALTMALLAIEAVTIAIYRTIDARVSTRLRGMATPVILAVLGSPLLWVLARQPFVGNRYKDTPLALYGPWVVLAILMAFSALGIWLGARLLAWLVGGPESRWRRATLLIVVMAAAAVGLVDALWYAGWYPLVHTVLSAATAVLVHVVLVVFVARSAAGAVWARRASVAVALLLPAAAAGTWLSMTQTTAWRASTGTLFSARVMNPLLLARSRPLDVSALAAQQGARPPSLVAARTGRETPPAIASSGVLVTVDTLRADAVGPSRTGTLTPAIDDFFASGSWFTRAYSQYASTRYSVTSILDSSFRDAGEPSTDDLISRLRDFGFAIYAVLPADLKLFVNVDRYHFDGVTFYDDEAAVPDAVRALTAGVPVEKRFVWVHLYQPHDPYAPPAELRRGRSEREGYEGEVRWMDRTFAQVIELLHVESGLVILAADHGEEFGEHGGTLHGRTGYDETLRVPLAVRAPTVAPARRTELVANVDIAPTVLAAFGIPVPGRYHGYDLLGRGSVVPADRTVYAETVTNAVVAVQHQRKWIHWTDQDLWEAYDLERDSRELRNLADVPAVMSPGRLLIDAFEWPWRTLPGLRRADAAVYEDWLRRAVQPASTVGELAREALFRAAASRIESPAVPELLTRGLMTEPNPLLRAELLRSLGPRVENGTLRWGPSPKDAATWLIVLRHANAFADAPALIEDARRHEVAAVRAAAAEQFARRNPSEAARVLDDSRVDPASRRGLVIGLAANAKAVPSDLFRRHLEDGDLDVRIAAIDGLCDGAASDVMAVLQRRAAVERSPSVFAVVLGRLLDLDRASGIQVLEREIKTPRLSNTVRVRIIADKQVVEVRQHLVDLFAATDTGGFRTLLFETASKLPLAPGAVAGLLDQMSAHVFEPGLRARIQTRIQALRSDAAGDQHHESGVPRQ